MIEHVRYGGNNAIKQKWVLVLVYFLQLIIALPIGMQVFQVIEASIGNSLSMDIIQDGFNRTVFEDFLNIHGASISPLLGTLRYIVPTYLLLSIFIHAGIIGNIATKEYSITSFFKNGLKYFIAFIKINLVMLLTILVWSTLVWIPYFLIVGNPVEDLSSEKVLVISLVCIGSLYIFGIILIWLWTLNSKFSKILNGENILSSLNNGWKKFKIIGMNQLGVFAIFAIIHGVTILLYFIITDPIGASSMFLIFFVMILQQIFSLFRVGLRIALYGSILSVAKSISIESV